MYWNINPISRLLKLKTYFILPLHHTEIRERLLVSARLKFIISSLLECYLICVTKYKPQRWQESRQQNSTDWGWTVLLGKAILDARQVLIAKRISHLINKITRAHLDQWLAQVAHSYCNKETLRAFPRTSNSVLVRQFRRTVPIKFTLDFNPQFNIHTISSIIDTVKVSCHSLSIVSIFL